MHSANWDHNYDYSHTRIAVIGNGSSGIQIVPQLVKLAGTAVTNFARGPAWIYYRVPPSQHLGKSIPSKNPPYTEEQQKNFRENEDALKEHRRQMIARTNKAFRMASAHPGCLSSCRRNVLTCYRSSSRTLKQIREPCVQPRHK